MAIGFIPSEEITIQFSPSEFPESRILASCLFYLKKYKWDVDILEERSIIADDSSWLRAGHTLEITWNEHQFHVVCRLNGIITDLGSCKRELQLLETKVKEYLATLSEEETNERLTFYTQELKAIQQQQQSALAFNPLHLILFKKEARAVSLLFWLLTALAFVTQIQEWWNYSEGVSWKMAMVNAVGLSLESEWYRLLTAVLIHFGLLHWLLNMANLILLGGILEPRTGRGFLVFSFLVGGISGNMLSSWWHEYNTLTCGSSGALFAWAGIIMSMILTKSIQDDSKHTYLISGIFLLLLSLFAGFHDSIDNVAHIGGLLSGLLIGFARFAVLEKPTWKWISLLLTLVFFVSIGILFSQKSKEYAVQKVSIQQWEMFRTSCMEELKTVTNAYKGLQDARLSPQDRYELASQLKKKLSTCRKQSGTITYTNLSPIQQQEYFTFSLYLEKNYEYCEVYQTVISPGGESWLPKLNKVKLEVDSLNYTLFDK